MNCCLAVRSGNTLVIVMIIVTLDVFSGRPNPEWTLTANEEAEFIRRLASAPIKVTRAPFLEEPLGYRGFRVRTAHVGRTPTELRVYNGWITDRGQTREDVGRGMERWLLDTGLATIGPDLAKHLAIEISSKAKIP
jgi:hypothetical protein